MNIFERLNSGEVIPFDHEQYHELFEGVRNCNELGSKFNQTIDIIEGRKILSEMFGSEMPETSRILPPLHINYGKNVTIGKNVFVNHDCTFLGLGKISIEDDVLIGPKVSLISEGHPVKPSERKALFVKPVCIKRGAWLGAGAIIMPGVTVGENSIVAAGAVVNKDVASNTIVAGVPAKHIRSLNQTDL